MYRSTYGILNLVIGLIPLAIILYSFLYTPDKQYRPIPSGSLLFSENPVISTGLSRSFSAAVRLDFEAAINYNPYGIRIFLFFIIQLFMRMAGWILCHRVSDKTLAFLIPADILLSISMFLVSFWPFLIAIFTNVSKL